MIRYFCDRCNEEIPGSKLRETCDRKIVLKEVVDNGISLIPGSTSTVCRVCYAKALLAADGITIDAATLPAGAHLLPRTRA